MSEAGPGAFGNAATRLENARGETDRAKREALLYKMQQMMVGRMIFAPIWQLAVINGVESQVTESALGLIPRFPTPRRTRTSR